MGDALAFAIIKKNEFLPGKFYISAIVALTLV